MQECNNISKVWALCLQFFVSTPSCSLLEYASKFANVGADFICWCSRGAGINNLIMKKKPGSDENDMRGERSAVMNNIWHSLVQRAHSTMRDVGLSPVPSNTYKHKGPKENRYNIASRITQSPHYGLLFLFWSEILTFWQNWSEKGLHLTKKVRF